MSTLRAVALLAVFSAWAPAQHAPNSFTFGQPAPRPNTYGSLGGFGNVVYPGTGHAPGIPFSITDPNFAYRLGNTVSGIPPRRSFVAVPYVYPILGGGYFGDPGYGYPQPPVPPVPVVPPVPGPQVIINQNFLPERANPVVREYAPDAGNETVHTYEAPGRAPGGKDADETPYYLIAFKDGSVYTAFAYWVEDDTLHYVTSQRVHNQASLSLVDRQLTERLNRDRSLQVKLPK